MKTLPAILIATPGRIVDLIKQKYVKLEDTKAVVFDEADRLFDMGFKKDIEFILSKMSDHRQLIMVSATSNMDVLNTAYKFKSHPVELKLNSDSLLVDNIDHSIAMVTSKEKMPLLVKMLRDLDDTYALVFCNTQFMTHVVAEWLMLMGFKAKPISGRLAQNKRTKLMQEFREKKITVLVCTDVAARGLDIKDVTFVCNYDLPQEAANYVHRIGRTGRAGANGKAVSFCAHEDCEFLDPIYELIEAKIPKLEITDDSFAKDIAKKPYIDYKTLKVVDRSSRYEDKKPREREKLNTNKKTEKFDNKPTNFKPYTLTEFQPYVKSESSEDKRFFVVTTSSLKEANNKALGYYRITDESLLESEVLKKGPKKFFFFGPRKTTYRFKIQPMYKKLLLPFVLEILKTSRLSLYAKITFEKNNVKIHFSGNDERMLSKNNNELLYAFEQLIKVFLTTRVQLPGNIRIKMSYGKGKTEKSFESPRDKNSKRGPRAARTPIDEKKIHSLVDKTVKTVVDSKSPITLKPMNSAERRVVHQYISENDKFKSTSIGDGRYKQIEISLA